MLSQLLVVSLAGRLLIHRSSQLGNLNLPLLRFFGGAFLGSLLQALVSPRYGRRATTGLAAIILIISGAIMAASYRIELFLTFRVVSGIGAGILTSNIPTYISEISPSHSRGILTSLHGISINAAYVSSSLFAFGFNFVHKPYQWRLQFIIFTFASGLLLLSVFYLPESPRWLVVCCNVYL